MEFGYFTLSDNHYANNPRTPNQFVADILDEALYADQLGYHSAWIASTISRRWASIPARNCCCRISPRAARRSASRRP